LRLQRLQLRDGVLQGQPRRLLRDRSVVFDELRDRSVVFDDLGLSDDGLRGSEKGHGGHLDRLAGIFTA
jgi:hypothetical protein